MNSVLMYVDAWIVSHPLRLCHVIQPTLFGIIYALFSYIYFLCSGTDPYVMIGVFFVLPSFFETKTNIPFLFDRIGAPYIYEVLNWEYPEKTILVVIGIIILGGIVHFILFWSYLLRVFIQEQLYEVGFHD